jgi:glycosyltransferase involved in cell wall biosynthesis
VNILHVVHQYYPEHVGGTEAYTRALALAQQSAGHSVTILARRFADGRSCTLEVLDGLDIVRAVSGTFSAAGRLASTLREPFLARCLVDTVRRVCPDIIHVQHLMGFPAAALRHAAVRAPIVVTLHDFWWRCANAQLYTNHTHAVCDGPRLWLNCAHCGLARFGAGALWPLAPAVAPVFAARALALDRLSRRVAAWTAPTAFVRDWHLRHGLPADRAFVVPHGIDLPDAVADLTRSVGTRDPGAGGAAGAHFAYLGGLSHQKGVHVLIEAFNRMPPGARLTIAGDESVFPAYCADLRRRTTHPGVRFVGLLDQAGVWRTLAEIDALVVPSVWYETSSLIAQEALAVGTPVVASDHGALAERVRHEIDGLRVPPGDVDGLHEALVRLASDPGLLARLRLGRQPVRTMTECAREIGDVYGYVLERARGSAS